MAGKGSRETFASENPTVATTVRGPGRRRTWMGAVVRPSQDGESQDAGAAELTDALMTSPRALSFGDFSLSGKEK
jgi:hypothetical protein